MTTEEVEALAKVAETAFVMGGCGEWDDAIHADCEQAGVVQKLRDVAIAVARAVRAQDAARGGTLSAESIAQTRVTAESDPTEEWSSQVVLGLIDHAAAQGRANAALEAEVSDVREMLEAQTAIRQAAEVERDRWQEVCSLVLGPEESSPVEAERNLLKLFDVRAALKKELDEARAELAARDARVKELEQRVVSLKAQLEKMQPIIRSAVERAETAESALATLRQRMEYIATVTPPLTAMEARQSAKDVLSSTPAEHPDTARVRALEAELRDEKAMRTDDNLLLADKQARAIAAEDTLREIRERGRDVEALGRAAGGLSKAGWDTASERDRVQYRYEGGLVAAFVLSDSGPSGGGEKRPMGHPCAGDSPAEVEKSRCPHSDFGDGVCTLPAGHAEPHRLSHDAPEIEDNSDSAFHTRLTASEEATLRMHINRAKAPPNDSSKHAKGCTVEWTPTPSGPTPRVWTCAPDCPSKATTPSDVAAMDFSTVRAACRAADEEASKHTPDAAASEPTPEEDWQLLETFCSEHDEVCIRNGPLRTDPCTCGAREASAALARLKSEPHRAQNRGYNAGIRSALHTCLEWMRNIGHGELADRMWREHVPAEADVAANEMPTLEEDWECVRRAVSMTRLPSHSEEIALDALARLKAEPRRTREATRAACIRAVRAACANGVVVAVIENRIVLDVPLD